MPFSQRQFPSTSKLGSRLLANILSAWLDREIVAKDTAEAAYEPPTAWMTRRLVT